MNVEKRKAFMIFDAMMAISILGILMGIMAIGLNLHQRTTERLANTRDACNIAEGALAELQKGNSRSSSAQLHVDVIPGGTPMPDYTWVRVTATTAGRSVSLVGLAKTIALKGG